eukprot:349846-Chlamydomonas_euryale.AAC.3
MQAQGRRRVGVGSARRSAQTDGGAGSGRTDAQGRGRECTEVCTDGRRRRVGVGRAQRSAHCRDADIAGPARGLMKAMVTSAWGLACGHSMRPAQVQHEGMCTISAWSARS